jgi:polyhydroxyalkanoate synthesis regulator phasin
MTAFLAAGANPSIASGVDQKLLDMLLANGSINAAQHAELTADLTREARIAERKHKREDRKKLDKKEFTAYQQTAGWAATTAFRGDMRARHDAIDIEDEPKFDTRPPGASAASGRDRNRQRFRARLGAFTQVNPEVETGIQLASGNSPDRRSTNQDLDTYFDKKAVWLDLAYIDYHPVEVPGLKIFAGKMKQPWMALGDVIWDGDINPEGFAASYQRKYGTTTLFGSAGYFILKDNVNGEGVQWKNDLRLYSLQGGVAFDASDRIRLTLGASLFDYRGDGEKAGQPAITLIANGNTTDEFSLYEGFGQMDVIGLPVPLTLYGQYVVNTAAADFKTFRDADHDTAWLVGARTNLAGIAFDYTYREVDRNAVVGYFTDSDFASGFTGSRGHKIKAQYDFLKNFNLTVSWFLAKSDVASRYNPDDAGVETVMIDLNARF